MERRVYLDHHSTTPVDPRVLDAMLPYFGQRFGNAASKSHSFGWEADKAVDLARKRIAELLGASPREIVFTSGATESDNLALKGTVEASGPGAHIITMATEHRAVLDTARHLERSGCTLTVLPPRPDGLLDLGQLREALRPETVLVSIMHANNEIGVMQPIAGIGALCRSAGVLFHCDAVQSFGKVPTNVETDCIDLLSMSAHKMYGPKGAGALYVRRRGTRIRMAAQMDGGGHESGMRSGTLNVPGIVGLGEACAISVREMREESARVGALRDRLKARLESELDGLSINGAMEPRLPGNLNVRFAGVEADALLMTVPEVALSTGSACSSATVQPSHVLKALGLSDAQARASVRFGVGRFNTPEEIDWAADRIIHAVRRLRRVSPVGSPV